MAQGLWYNYKNKDMKIFHHTQRAFTLLYAILIMSAVLSIVFAILSITVKQLQLSSVGKDSESAFYAADSGLKNARGIGMKNMVCLPHPRLPAV